MGSPSARTPGIIPLLDRMWANLKIEQALKDDPRVIYVYHQPDIGIRDTLCMGDLPLCMAVYFASFHFPSLSLFSSSLKCHLVVSSIAGSKTEMTSGASSVACAVFLCHQHLQGYCSSWALAGGRSATAVCDSQCLDR